MSKNEKNAARRDQNLEKSVEHFWGKNTFFVTPFYSFQPQLWFSYNRLDSERRELESFEKFCNEERCILDKDYKEKQLNKKIKVLCVCVCVCAYLSVLVYLSVCVCMCACVCVKEREEM